MKKNVPWEQRIQSLIQSGRIPAGAVVQCEVKHDTWCPALNTGRGCKCDPDIELIDLRTGKPLPPQ